ncbi:diacylglycerol kinase family protein [Aurantiacibacter aquimixticola]|nr:acylglycerol kinase family protein [Aurantiacibacter aquimixticola]
MHGSVHLFESLPQVPSPSAAPKSGGRTSGRATPLVGLIRNARSHRNEGNVPHGSEPENVIATAPARRSDLAEILADFAARGVDCIAIDGGDGTVRDVLTCGAGVFGESWPALIVLPNGKTNALASDLGIPTGWTLEEALASLGAGSTVRRCPLVIAQRDHDRKQVRGFIMGGGVFNKAIALGQRSHDLGAFNAAVVGVTAAWSVAQALLGRADNGWRRGSRMRVRSGNGVEIPHLGGLPEDERYLLLATTLDSFPAGITPFRGIEEPVRVALLDNPRRGLLLRLAALIRGNASAATKRRGAHVFGDESIEAELSDSFILDGEAFPSGHYRIRAGGTLRFVTPQ